VSRRLPSPLYAGASGRSTLGKACYAGARYAIAPKWDGSYVTAVIGADGKLSRLILRSGEFVGRGLMADFAGIRYTPNSIIIAEAEIWTEASNRFASARGYRNLWALDCLRIAGRDVSSLPYRARRSALLQADDDLMRQDEDRPWVQDVDGRAHDHLGRWTRPTPLCWRRLRITPERPAREAEALWRFWVEQDGADGPVEGLVLIALDAPLGKGKQKIKIANSVDATVIQTGPRDVVLAWAGKTFACSRGKHELVVGDWVEVAADAFYEKTSTPRHPRIIRKRPDLGRGVSP
jgi:hypothetical protein